MSLPNFLESESSQETPEQVLEDFATELHTGINGELHSQIVKQLENEWYQNDAIHIPDKYYIDDKIANIKKTILQNKCYVVARVVVRYGTEIPQIILALYLEPRHFNLGPYRLIELQQNGMDMYPVVGRFFLASTPHESPVESTLLNSPDDIRTFLDDKIRNTHIISNINNYLRAVLKLYVDYLQKTEKFQYTP